MDNSFNWGQASLYVGAVIVVNGILLKIAAYYIKRWMDDTDEKAKQTAKDLAAITLEHSKNLAASTIESRKELATATAAIALDIKTDLREHREDDRIRLEDIKKGIDSNKDEFIRTGGEIKASIDELAKHQRELNGKTGKIEGKVDTQIAVCKQIQREKVNNLTR